MIRLSDIKIIILIGFFLMQFFFPIIGSIGIHTTYAYQEEFRTLQSNIQKQSFSFQEPKMSFSLRIHSDEIIRNEDEVKIRIESHGIVKETSLDLA